MKILIIEDEILLADSLRAMLEGKGFSVEAVHDGETGAEYAETGVSGRAAGAREALRNADSDADGKIVARRPH